MNILVTGGTGFLGGATARHLQREGHHVTVLGRNRGKGEALRRDGISFLPVDLSDRAATIDACRRQEAVVHCAALASPWGPYRQFYDANVVGTRHVLEGCHAHGVRRLVNISTPSIYFDWKDRLQIRESDPIPERLATPYAETKWLADKEVEAATRAGLESISLRPRAIFGPGDTSVLGRALRAAARGVVPLVDGGVSQIDMTYIDNTVDAIALALNAPAELSGRVYNITNGEPKPMRDVLEMLFEKLEWKVRYRRLSFPMAYALASVMESVLPSFTRREPPLTRYAIGLMSKSQTLDISAARQELGYEPKVSLEAGFAIYGAWWRNEKEGRA